MSQILHEKNFNWNWNALRKNFVDSSYFNAVLSISSKLLIDLLIEIKVLNRPVIRDRIEIFQYNRKKKKHLRDLSSRIFNSFFIFIFCRIPRRVVASVVMTLSNIPKKIHAVNPQFSPRFHIFVAVEVMSGAFSHSIARITQQ